MRRFHIWIVLIAVLFCANASAQSLKRKVIASAGGRMVAGGYQLSYTIGEPVIQVFSNSGTLRQGFQQPDLSTSLALQTQSLMTFSAYAEENTAKLVFISRTPIATDYLELQRVNNETGTFEVLETVNSNFGIDVMDQQTFKDLTPQDGDNIYRVKQVFDDGSSRLSVEQKLNFQTTQIALYPNPAHDYLRVDLSSYEGKEATVTLFSTNGHMLLQKKIEKANRVPIQLDLDGVETGYYQVHIQVAGKRAVLKQVVITK